MTGYTLIPARDLVPGSRFLLGEQIVSVTQVIRGTETVAVWHRGGAMVLPADRVVDATLPESDEVRV